MSSFIGPQSVMAAQVPGLLWHYIGYDLIYTDENAEEWTWVSGNRMPPPHTCFAVAFGLTFHAVMSLQFMSLHAVSHCQSYTHAVLHVGSTEDRDPRMRISSVSSDIPHYIYNNWDMVRIRCVTRVIQSCMSNHMCLQSFSHSFRVSTMFTCSVIVLCVTLPGMYCPCINFMLWSPERFYARHGYWHPRIKDR